MLMTGAEGAMFTIMSVIKGVKNKRTVTVLS